MYGQAKRLEQGNPRPGETLRSAAEGHQHALWPLIRATREAMRADLGVTGAVPRPAPTSAHDPTMIGDFEETGGEPPG